MKTLLCTLTASLLCLSLVAGCTAPVSSSASAAPPAASTGLVLTPQPELTDEQHLTMLLGCVALAQPWWNAEQLDPDVMVDYYLALTQEDTRLPQPDSNSLVDAADVEQVAALYFDAKPEQLRKSRYYRPETNSYELFGLGSVASCVLYNIRTYKQETTLFFDIFGDGEPFADGQLVLCTRPDGSWYYKSYVMNKPKATAEQQAQWAPVLMQLDGGILGSSWERGDDIPSYLFASYYLRYVARNDPDRLPSDAETLVLSAEEFEDFMQQRLPVSTAHLRTMEEFDKATMTYGFVGGLGSGAGYRVESVTEQEGELQIAYLAYNMAGARYQKGTLTLRMDGDQLYCLRHTAEGLLQKLTIGYAPDGPSLDKFQKITEEQRALYQKAFPYIEAFVMDVGRFPDEEYDDTRQQSIVQNGYTYWRYTGVRRSRWADFYRDCLTVFTPAFFDRLNMVDYMGDGVPVPLYIDHNGELYHLTNDRGSDHSYVGKEQFSLNHATDSYLSFDVYSFYRDIYLPEEGPPTHFKSNEVAMRKTADGWRIDQFTLPY